MNTWIIDALDPLFFGDGRPVAQGVAEGRMLPPPQALAGLVRTRQGQNEYGAWHGDSAAASQIPVHGPFPALLNLNGDVVEWLFPKPSDALYIEASKEHMFRRLVPLNNANWGAISNLPSGLVPVGLASADPSKPLTAPPLWRWTGLRTWLTSSQDSPCPELTNISAPLVETRTHVAIDPETGHASDGMLFSTAGRRMLVTHGDQVLPMGLGLRTNARLQQGIAPVGGERRLARWRPSSVPFPSIPDAVLKSAEAGAVRVLLITPGLFRSGWYPSQLFDAPEGSSLAAACVGRPEVISGWDLAARRARPTRRCAPPGSVYFLRLGGDAAARRAWATEAWLSARADTIPNGDRPTGDRLDGFGVVLLGVWDGQLVTPTTHL